MHFETVFDVAQVGCRYFPAGGLFMTAVGAFLVFVSMRAAVERSAFRGHGAEYSHGSTSLSALFRRS
jgi:hypothetical protein